MKNICYDNFVTTYYKRNVTGTSIFLKSLTRKIKREGGAENREREREGESKKKVK